jgi:ABC-type ATPase with predicted acetyltransferase domain
MRVARKVAEIIREAGITALIITHRPEVLKALDPDRVLFVGYGTARVQNAQSTSKKAEPSQ